MPLQVRNFQLFRLEATYEIREDLADVLQRVQPYAGEDGRVGLRCCCCSCRRCSPPLLHATAAAAAAGAGAASAGAHPTHSQPSPPSCVPLQTGFGGWARMAQLVDKFSITEVRKPKVGEAKPAGVTGGWGWMEQGGGDRGPIAAQACNACITPSAPVRPPLAHPLPLRPTPPAPSRSRDHPQPGQHAARDAR